MQVTAWDHINLQSKNTKTHTIPAKRLGKGLKLLILMPCNLGFTKLSRGKTTTYIIMHTLFLGFMYRDITVQNEHEFNEKKLPRRKEKIASRKKNWQKMLKSFYLIGDSKCSVTTSKKERKDAANDEGCSKIFL